MAHEDIALMEPMLPTQGNRELEDLAMTLVKKGSALSSYLNPVVQKSIGNLVRSMNCYYSNLIEGHDTHPRDIDKALKNDFSNNPEQRNLQLEAKAHIEVQKLIDNRELEGEVSSTEFIARIHKEFCTRLPAELLWLDNKETGKKLEVLPGELRNSEVKVGRHHPPLAKNVDKFMNRFEQAYDPDVLSQIQQIIAIAASHHRLVWIHPFLDGNGRVARLYSHAYLLHTEIGCSLWSVSRGLARNVEAYKSALMAADAPRKGDLDGRGNLSHENLVRFCSFFLNACIDQVEFMGNLIDREELLNKMKIHISEEISVGRLLPGSFQILREALISGEFRRSHAQDLTNYKERQAREVLSRLLDNGYLISDTPKGAVRLGFPNDAVERWLPRLYPDY
ncbi:MAG: Fic family protein [Proteobacteria bacterium]|nr:Fic family protein [Pseudomonadota bacterium]